MFYKCWRVFLFFARLRYLAFWNSKKKQILPILSSQTIPTWRSFLMQAIITRVLWGIKELRVCPVLYSFAQGECSSACYFLIIQLLSSQHENCVLTLWIVWGGEPFWGRQELHIKWPHIVTTSNYNGIPEKLSL